MHTKGRICRFLAKILIMIMLFQGWPLYELSRQHVYVFPHKRVQKLLDLLSFLGPAEAEAASPKVVCVPQLPSDLLVPHETWAGRPTILKGVARDVDDNLAGGTYSWDFGDGAQSALQTITNADNLSATHTYTAEPGTLFIARLHVTDAAGESSSDEYRVLVKDKTLDVEVNKAIDDGMWWIYTNREKVDIYSVISQNHLVAPDGSAGLRGEYFNNTSLSGSPALVRVDPAVAFEWGSGSPGGGVNSDNFSVRWTGEIHITEPGDYTFATYNDDGTRLYIDEQLVIDNWWGHGPSWYYSATMPLTSGPHTIRLEFFEAGGGANVSLCWIPQGQESCRWNNVRYGSHYANTTASAVQAFEINGHLETGNPDEDPYVNAVRGGLTYLLNTLITSNMTGQTYGHPEDYNNNNDATDDGGNGIGLSVSSDRSIYESGAVMDAFVATGTPEAVAQAGGVNVVGRTYRDIVQDMVDMYAWGQGDWNNGGGWRYSWNDWPDNSASQWGAIGIIAAERHFGCQVPVWVKEQNDRWLTTSYDGVGFGYTGAGRDWATSPSGMIQLSFAEKDTSDPRWITAEASFADAWTNNSNWFIDLGRNNRYYSYYAFTKAMRLALPQEVTHLSSGLDWYGDESLGLARVLADRQNVDGSWAYDDWPYVGERTAAAWNVIILTRTLFEKPPVGVIKAQPNPGATGQEILLDASSSYHVDPAKQIVQYLWDFNASDGVDFEHPDATGPLASAYYGDLGDYQVSLKVMDDSTPVRFHIASLTVRITIPPHPPTAVIGGPYLGSVGEEILVDGSGSYDIDEQKGDEIIAWEWESDFVAPYDFDEAGGVTAYLPAFGAPGRYDIALRVTDNTAGIFPQSGQPNLTHTAYGEVVIYKSGMEDLAARPKGTKCQLTWTHAGAAAYKIFRSETGPNEGYEQIGTTASTYSTFLDYNLIGGSTGVQNRCIGDLNGDGDVDGADQTIFLELVDQLHLDADLNGDGIIDTGDVEFFAAEYGRSDCFSDNGIDLNKDYWYRVMAEVNGEWLLSVPVYVYSQGRIINLPPVITSVPVTDARESEPYTYLVEAYDPEGESVEYLLDLAPAGMGIDQAGGQIHWTPSRNQVGLHDIMVRVRDASGISATQFYQILVDPRPNLAPSANPGGPYEDVLIHEAVTLTGSGVDPEGDPIVEYRWIFGDGGQAYGQTVEHTYVAPGRYSVTLYVTDDRGAVGHAETYCQVGLANRPPIAHAGGPYEVEINQPLTLDGSLSYDPDADTLIFTWNFGDSTPAATGMQVTHTYTAEGVYQVSVGVDDGRGGLDTAVVEVVVTPPNQAPSAVYTLSGQAVSLETMTFDGRGSSDPDGSITSYHWDFGDGVSTTGSWVSHAFPSEGTFQVTLTVTDNKGATGTETHQVTVTPNQPPHAVLNVSGNLLPGRVIDFTAAGSTDPEGGALTYAWDFGDGGTAQGLEASYTYGSEGQYTVTLTVTDHVGLSAQVTKDIPIASLLGPVAVFSASGPMAEGENITFDGSGSYDQSPGGSVVSHSWDFGDGSTAAGAVATHAYASAGRYEVRLTVTDDDGNTCTALAPLEIGVNEPPQAIFGFSGRMVEGAEIEFNAYSSYDPEGHALTYSWDFGDGAVAGGVKPKHVFSTAGDYTVSLTVTDDKGQSDTESRLVHVVSSTAPQAAFRVSGDPLTGQALHFDGGDSTAGPGRSIQSYSWDMGDGTVASGVDVMHAYAAPGQFEVTLKVTDDLGGWSEARTVMGIYTTINHYPNLILSCPTMGVVNEPVHFIASASDPDGDTPLILSWEFGDGQTAAGPSVTNTYGAAGDYTVSVKVEDGRGGQATASCTVRVVERPAQNVAPSADAGGPYEGNIGEEIQLDGSLSFDLNGDSLTYAWDFGDGGSGSGATPTHAYTAPGTYEVTLTVFDPSGENGTDTAEVRVYDPADPTPPSVSVLTPGEGAVVRQPTDIVGSVQDTDLDWWKLEYAQTGGEDYKEIAFGQDVRDTEILGRFDPTVLKNGFYSLRLTAKDHNNHVTRVVIPVKVAGGLKVGIFTLSFTDLVVPVGGIPITITRSYDSRDKVKHDFGIGWRMGLKTTEVQEDEGLNVFITLPDGSRALFAFTPQYRGIWSGMALYRPKYTPAPGVNYDLTCPGCATQDITDYWAGQWIDPITFMDYNPDVYILTEKTTGRVYTIDQFDGLQSVRDRNGNTLAFTYDGITHSSGKNVTFVRDAEGRITTITDPNGNTLEYEYHSLGDLEVFTNQEGEETRFTYHPGHYLDEMIFAEASSVSTEYDEQGRVKAHVDPDGNRIEYQYDLDNRQQVLKDRLGNATTLTYDDEGRVTRATDPLGYRVERTYDGAGNLTAVTDQDGNTTRFEYDAHGNVTKKIDPLGYATVYGWDASGNLVSVTDALGSTYRFEYDGDGNRTKVVDPLSNETVMSYDPSGNLSSITDALGAVITYSYDAYGHLTQVQRPDGNVVELGYDANGNILSNSITFDWNGSQETLTTQYDYDKAGRLTKTVYPDGTEEETVYNEQGLPAQIKDRFGGSAGFVYDAFGRKIQDVFPDGTFTQTAYDAEGNVVYQTDRTGKAVNRVYDPAGRMSYASATGGETTALDFTPTGRIASIQQVGERPTRFGYDAAGRIISVGAGTNHYQRDAAGRIKTVTNSAGQSLTFEYDEGGRITKVTAPGGLEVEATYDALGRTTAVTDPLGTTTLGYGNPTCGCGSSTKVTKVTDPLGNVTEYAYDSRGNIVSRIDANGHETRYEYDLFGRRTKTILPMGQEATINYDALGRPVSFTDFNGKIKTFSYDEAGPLKSIAYSGGKTIQYTYTSLGYIETATDENGTVRYTYGSDGRPTRIAWPDGRFVEYSYDSWGNILSRKYPHGTVAYEYDGSNRISAVTDHEGRRTEYTYDGLGNLVKTSYPNGVSGEYVYSATTNYLVEAKISKSDGTVLARYLYGYNGVGMITSVDEEDGSRVEYTYDSQVRILREKRTGIDPYDISYTYDKAGNRLSMTRDGVTTSYTYDGNDRLLTAGAVSFGYDASGNLLSRTDAGGTVSYGYDAEHRMVSFSNQAGETYGYTYDPFGHRVVASGPAGETRFLIDPLFPVGQVVEKTDPDGGKTYYTIGNERVSQEKDGILSFNLMDGQSRVRGLLDEDGDVVASYGYTVFGESLYHDGPRSSAFRYATEYLDEESALYYLRARHMDPATGRFLSRDPLPGWIMRPVTQNPYSYVENNPANFVDPSGRMTLIEKVVVGSIIAIMAHIAFTSGVEYYHRNLAPVAWGASFFDINVSSATAIGGKLSIYTACSQCDCQASTDPQQGRSFGFILALTGSIPYSPHSLGHAINGTKAPGAYATGFGGFGFSFGSADMHLRLSEAKNPKYLRWIYSNIALASVNVGTFSGNLGSITAMGLAHGGTWWDTGQGAGVNTNQAATALDPNGPHTVGFDFALVPFSIGAVLQMDESVNTPCTPAGGSPDYGTSDVCKGFQEWLGLNWLNDTILKWQDPVMLFQASLANSPSTPGTPGPVYYK